MKTRTFTLLKKFSINTVFVLSIALGVSACSSPADKARGFYDNGMKLLDKGDLAKASIEFRNALQIDGKMTKALWGLALVAERQSKWDLLYSVLNKVLENEPNHLEAQVKLGNLLLAAGKLDKALEFSNKSFAAEPDNISVLALRATVFLKLDASEEAIKYANIILAREPENINALVVLASERLSAGDAEKAIEYMDKGLVANDKHVALQLFKIQALTKLANFDKAEEIYQKLIRYYPDKTAFNKALASFYIRQKRFDDAEKEFRNIVALHPADLDAKMTLINFTTSTKGVDAGRDILKAYVENEPENYELKFSLVEFYNTQGSYADAEAVLNSIIETQKDNENGIKARSKLAATLLTKGDKQAAEVALKQVLEIDAKNEQALLVKASMDIDVQKYDDAIGNMRTVLRDTPNSSRALFLLAKAYQQSGSPELADNHYLKAYQSSNNNPAYGMAYAEFLIKRNQHQRAESILEELLVRYPTDLAVLKLLARTKLTLGDWSGAQRVVDLIRKKDGKDGLADQIAGAIQVGQKNYNESISSFKRAYEASPDQSRPIVALVQTYLLAGRVNDASAFLDAVINANPDNYTALLLRGQLYVQLNDIAAAADAYQKLISLVPTNPLGYYQQAILQVRSKELDKADATIKAGLDKVPDNFLLSLTLASIYELKGDFEQAISVYEKLLDKRPDSEVVANNLASLLSEYRTDEKSLNRSYALSQRFKQTDIPQFKDTFGWASYKVGKYADASSLLENAVEELPGMPVFHYHLGMTHLAKKDKAAARKELEKALELAGDESFDQAAEIRNVLKDL